MVDARICSIYTMPNTSEAPTRGKRKVIPKKNPVGDEYARPVKKPRTRKTTIMSEDEEEEMVRDGIDEVIEEDVDGNEHSRRPVRRPSLSSITSMAEPIDLNAIKSDDETETDEQKLGMCSIQ
jgi:hypothetical protein